MNCIHKNESNKASFQHDVVYIDFKDLPRRMVAERILYDKAFNVTKNSNYDRYHRGLASMVL